MRKYQLIIIGAGPAGYKAAFKAAELGAQVLLIEKDKDTAGGTCLNRGCIPVKSLLESTALYKKVLNGRQFGVCAENIKFDMQSASDNMNNNIANLTKALTAGLKKAGVEIVYGRAEFASCASVSVNGEEYTADKFIIASGSKPAELKGFLIDNKYIFDSSAILQNTRPIKNLLIIGAGAIGCEFASIYKGLGADVTVAEVADRILPQEDADVSRGLAREFKKAKIKIKTGVTASLKSLTDAGAQVAFTGKKDEQEAYDAVLVAAGRQADISPLALDKAGVETLGGRIKTDEYLCTANKNIYAAGDVLNTMMLAHTAYYEGVLAAENALRGNIRTIEKKTVPTIVYSHPQTAGAGLTEEQAAERNINYKVYKSFFAANAKAVISKDTAGFVKIIADADTGVAVGAHILGELASELIHELALAIENNLTIGNIKNTIHGHPTLSETVADALH